MTQFLFEFNCRCILWRLRESDSQLLLWKLFVQNKNWASEWDKEAVAAGNVGRPAAQTQWPVTQITHYVCWHVGTGGCPADHCYGHWAPHIMSLPENMPDIYNLPSHLFLFLCSLCLIMHTKNTPKQTVILYILYCIGSKLIVYFCWFAVFAFFVGLQSWKGVVKLYCRLVRR